MKTSLKLGTIAAAIAALSFTAPAMAGDAYKIDPAHAWVQFSTNHAGWAKARGNFSAISGDIDFDKADVTKSSVKVVIEAASINTNFDGRDDHLRSPDFLNAEEFPTIDFKSTSIEKTGEKTALVTGDMTLVGVTKPVVLDVVWNAESPLPWDAKTIKTGFSATTTINAVDFGMSKVPQFGLGPDITIAIDVEAVKQ